MRKPLWYPGRYSLALLLTGMVLGSALLVSCGHEKDEPVDNIRPFVRLTGGPVDRGAADNDSVNYSTEFLWTGWDEDGIIDHYEYAVDIPDDLLGEIDNPNPTGIAWVDTTAFRARFLFSTPEQDTILNTDGTITLPDQYRGDHTFYVRAVDNDGGVSDAQFVNFTARTATPQTRFTIPQVVQSGQVLNVGRQLNVAWEGTDPDNPDPRRKPAFFEWKLIEVPFVTQVNDANYTVLVTPGPQFPWHRVGADTTKLSLSLDPPKDYVLAIRAIDEAGGVENKFILGRNAILLASLRGNPGTPTLSVREKTAGTFNFPGDGEVWEIEAPVSRCMRFDFQGNGEAYGGEIQGYNYGVDVPDVDQEGPTSGFRGWSSIRYTYEPICFTSPGVHALTIKVRDTGGGITVATVLIRVIAFPLDREVLYLDDYRLTRSQGVTDQNMDDKVTDMLQSVGFSLNDPQEIFEVAAWADDDVQAVPTTVKLSDMARYKYVLWSVLGTGYGGTTALVGANACPTGRVIQSYVAAGGSLWVYGQQVFGAFKKFPGGECKGTAGYDEGGSAQPLNFGPPIPNEFICEFLHLCGGSIRSARNSRANGLIRARPSPETILEGLPTVEVDSSSINISALGGIPFIDAIFQQVFEPGLDTVYVADQLATGNSSFKGRPIAFRYSDPNPIPEQGPVAVFGFPFHFLKQGTVELVEGKYRGTGVKGMAGVMFDWFRQHGGVAQAALSPPQKR